MKLEKLLWSKTKVDILKYLIFKRQGISLRALENELERSFPAIKKQADLLEEAEIINIDKDNTKWSIYLEKEIEELVKKIFLYSLESDLKNIILPYDTFISKYYLWSVFGRDINVDLVLIYKSIWKDFLDKVKEEINEVFRDYFIDVVWVVFMSEEDFNRRYRLADKFVLSLIWKD